MNRLLEAGEDGFEGGKSTQKYMKIAKTSKANATLDLQDLVERSPSVNGCRPKHEVKGKIGMITGVNTPLFIYE